MSQSREFNFGSDTRAIFRVAVCLLFAVFKAGAAEQDQPVILKAIDANDRSFTHVSLGKGRTRSIHGILQDGRGFMWFAGPAWLERYDGHEIRDYPGSAKDPNNATSFTRAMIVGRGGKLWLARDRGIGLNGPFGSLEEFDPAGETIPSIIRSAPFNVPVVHVLEDKLGILWLSTNRGLFRMDPKTRRIVGQAGLSAEAIRATLEAKDGSFWVATAKGVDLFDRASGRVRGRYPFMGDLSETVPYSIAVSLCEDSAGNIWVASSEGLGRVDRKTGRLVRFRLDMGEPRSRYAAAATVYADSEGALWIGTANDGLLMLNPERTRLVRYRNNPLDSESLSGNAVLSVYEDRENNMWVGTNDAGLNVFPRKPRPFKHYVHVPGDKDSLDSNHIRSILEDTSGILWVATLHSLDKIDRSKGVITHYRQTGGPGELSNTVIVSSVEDPEGYLWFGTLNYGLNRLDARTGKFRVWLHDKSDPRSLGNDSVSKLLVDSKGRLWVGTVTGLDLFENGSFRHVLHVRVMDIAEDANGKLWIATRASGLLHLDPATGEEKYYRSSPDGGSLSNDQTTGLCIDHTGGVWVGTLNGLNRLDAVSGRFKTYYEKDGLPDNSVSRILEDGAGNLWVSTGYGISRLNPGTGVFTIYDASDGIAGNEFYGYASAWKSRTGEMFFSSYSGLTAFFPKEVVDNPHVPPIAITSLRVSGLDKPYPLGSGMRLPAQVRDIRIEYAALSFVAPEKNRFKYKLEGYDDDWQDAGTRRQAFYTNLPPRDYRFRVIGSNNSGVWNEAGEALEFSIAAAYYQTTWFRVLCAALVIGGLGAAYRYRMWEVQRESRHLREVIETIPGYVWSAQPDGSVDFINHRWLEFSGFSLDQALGWGWAKALHPDDRERLVGAWRAAVASGKPMDAEARMRGADGQYRWLLFRNVPLRNGAGKIVKWYGKSTDIEDIKRARQLESDMAHINRVSMMGELAASVAHEVNQPLTGIVSNGSACLRMLAGDTPGVEEIREAVGDMVRDGKRAGEVIARIRAMTKKAALPRERLDLNDAIREVLVLVGDHAKSGRVGIETRFAEDLAPVFGDKVQLQQVLLNLAVNAIQAMSEVEGRPRRLTIHTRNVEGGQVEVTVEDSGVGLDAAEITRIFQPFYTTKSSGMGMGLSICRSIVENHGGRLWATVNEGDGVSFHFTLPQRQQQEQDAGAAAV